MDPFKNIDLYSDLHCPRSPCHSRNLSKDHVIVSDLNFLCTFYYQGHLDPIHWRRLSIFEYGLCFHVLITAGSVRSRCQLKCRCSISLNTL